MTHITRWAPHGARFILGLIFTVIGLDFFLTYLPPLDAPPEKAAPFLRGLEGSGYIMPIIKAVEVAAGLALLANRFVPLALTMLAPIIVNIVAFHLFLAPSYPMPLTILALELYLAWWHRLSFLPLLRPRSAQVDTRHTPGHLSAPAS